MTKIITRQIALEIAIASGIMVFVLGLVVGGVTTTYEFKKYCKNISYFTRPTGNWRCEPK